jgi:hypothetical protein
MLKAVAMANTWLVKQNVMAAFCPILSPIRPATMLPKPKATRRAAVKRPASLMSK